MVGARFAEEVRRRDPKGARVRVTVLGAEPRPAYNRVLLSTVLAGGLPASAVELHPVGWAVRAGVDLRIGVTATAIDRERRVVHTDDAHCGGERYDDVVLATGSRACLPPIDGIADPSVVTFRDLADCERIIALACPGARFAVLGGGLLGCEAARGLVGRGMDVTLVHSKPHLMGHQLDPGAGEVLAATLRRLGVDVQLGRQAVGWEPGVGLRCRGSVESCDSLVPADALVIAAGVRPEVGLAADAGIAVDRGVLVDDQLTTSDPRVHAIGDCAQHAGTTAGLVQPGWEQAGVLADLVTGADPGVRYRGTLPVTRLKACDVDLATVGDPRALDGFGAEVLRFADPVGGRYASLALLGDRVVAGAMIGLPDAAASMIQFYDTGMPAPADRLGLLFGRALPGVPETADPGHLLASTVVCRCNTVTKGALVAAWRGGATDAPALSRATRAGTGCGSCCKTIRDICAWLAQSEPPVLGLVREDKAV
ncbi:FAD-dependent oxidoreductase [Pseudonocardia alaniniphila]|uniref:FAD-dependent oxidoreductase n=2 Tax=Pseudonocardia alaniniphila TaxID=75291 RepID=A0ABS9TVM5_9PSEU|nr:FAD-dependent oxidoreductase [Pseudonocardia alaniniphila]